MRKTLKWLLGCLIFGLLAAGLCAWWFLNKVSNQPRAWRAEAVVEISASPDVVFEGIADLKRWPEWSSWTRDVDSGVERRYSGAPQGAGAVLTWDAQGSSLKLSVGGPVKVGVHTDPNTLAETVGKGTLRVVSADPDKGVELETRYQNALLLSGSTREGAQVMRRSSLRTHLNGTDFVVTGRITTDLIPTGTRVRWVEEGTFGDGLAGGMLAMAMRDMVEEEHTEILSMSLDGLKQRMESPR